MIRVASSERHADAQHHEKPNPGCLRYTIVQMEREIICLIHPEFEARENARS